MKEISCYNCKENELCFLYHNIQKEIVDGLKILNIDSKDRPKTFQDIFNSLALACFRFKEIEK